MSEQGRLYYFACWLMWVVISQFDLLYDIIPQTDEANKRSDKWFHVAMSLANWLSESRFFPLENEKVPSSLQRVINSNAEDLGDLLYSKWKTHLISRIENASRSFPKIDISMLLYFYYCRWLSETLNEFGGLFQRGEISLSQYNDHYQQKGAEFRELALLLQNEVLILHADKVDNDESLITDIETNAKQLAQEWHQAVLSAAGNPYV